MGLTPSITPFKLSRIGDSNEYRVSWTEWDGNCMCTRITRHGEITVTEDKSEFTDIQQAIKDKYYGDN